ncbi:MAG: Rnase Y domain-containing protein, partial [Acidimicrobiia bacterium]
MDVVTTIIVGIVALAVGLISGFFAFRSRSRRSMVNADVSAEGVVLQARREAQRVLVRAEDEGRAKAEAYREREEAALEHRRLEAKSSEERLNQREQTLEQRAGNLAQREQ